MYPEKLIRDNVVAQFLQLPLSWHLSQSAHTSHMHNACTNTLTPKSPKSRLIFRTDDELFSISKLLQINFETSEVTTNKLWLALLN